MYKQKMIFYMMMMISIFMAISSSSWLGMWMSLEINLMSIIPLMSSVKNLFSVEASLKYFLIQVLASIILLYSLISMTMQFFLIKFQFNIYSMLLNLSLLIKMGSAPFHFWMPEIMNGLSWTNTFIILTIQKIPTLIIFSYIINYNFMFIIIISNLVIGGIMGLNQTSMRKILTYSSITHLGWILSTMLILQKITLYYMITYTIIMFNMIIILKTMKIFYLNQLMYFFNNKMIKLLMIFNFFSIMGMPPFLGFFPKWITIQYLMLNNWNFMMIMMIFFNLITMYYYMKILVNLMIMKNNKINYYFNLNKIYYPYLLLSSLISIMLLFISTLILNYI